MTLTKKKGNWWCGGRGRVGEVSHEVISNVNENTRLANDNECSRILRELFL